MLHDKADDVLSLEKRKMQLETAMKERTEEIKTHMDVLQVQIKHIEQEQQGIRCFVTVLGNILSAASDEAFIRGCTKDVTKH
eukprot:g33164.t1